MDVTLPVFLLNSAALGLGLAMDAFSVSLANGLHEPAMSRRRACAIAGVYALFQYAMPMIGWLCVRTIAEAFSALRAWIPWIALALLCYIGGKMLLEAKKERLAPEERAEARRLSARDLLIQGVATSIDALSVGFTLAEERLPRANLAGTVIGAVTFCVCLGGLYLGRRAGTRLSWRASVLGGCILIAIGLEIVLKSVL